MKTMLVLVVAFLIAGVPSHATLLSSGVDLKTAGRTTEWALFGLRYGIDFTDTRRDQFANRSVIGDVGASNGSDISLRGTTRVAGSAYVKNNGVLRNSRRASIDGGLAPQSAQKDANMVQVQMDADAAANQANALPNNNSGVTYSGWKDMNHLTVNQNNSLSLDAPAGAHVVLHLTDFVLSGGAAFTLSGSALTTYVINVSNKFTLARCEVILAGGLLPENVLFNIMNPGARIAITAGAQFNGFLLATKRMVNVSRNSRVNGTIIAAGIKVSGGSRILKPPYTSP